MKMGVYKTVLRAERAEKVLVCTPSCDFWGTLVANKVKKSSNEFVWGQDGSLGGQCAPSCNVTDC